MWKDWMDERLGSSWLSDGMKRSMLTEYGEVAQEWSRHRMSQVASEVGDVIDLAAGTQHGFTRPPRHVLEAIHKGIDEGSFDAVPHAKVGQVHQAIARKFERTYGFRPDSESEVTLCPGAAFVIDSALRILVNSGDEVLIIDPDYATYEEQAKSYTSRVVPVPLREDPPGRWRFDLEELERRVGSRTKLLMMSNANNPTSYLYTKEDNEAILELAEKKGFFVLSDQVSEEILFDGAKYHSIASLPGAMERTIVASSLSKLYNLSGFRVGYAVANKKIIEQIDLLEGWVTDGIVSPATDAALAVFNNGEATESYVREVLADLQKRRDYMIERLEGMEGVVSNHPTALYWAFPNVANFGVASHDLAEFLMREGVYVRPGTWYGRTGEGHFRLSFCVSWSSVKEGMNRMEIGLRKFRESHPRALEAERTSHPVVAKR